MRKICMLIVQHIKPTIYGIFCRAQRDSRPVRNDESSARVTCITLGSISFATEASSLLRFRFSGAAASPSFSPPPHQQPMVTSPLSMTCLRKRKTNDQKKREQEKGSVSLRVSISLLLSFRGAPLPARCLWCAPPLATLSYEYHNHYAQPRGKTKTHRRLASAGVCTGTWRNSGAPPQRSQLVVVWRWRLVGFESLKGSFRPF